MMDETSVPYHPLDDDAWHHATAAQLLDLLKLLNVEQRAVARRLGVRDSTVSMWLHGHRKVPATAKPILLPFAQQCVMEAMDRVRKEVQSLTDPAQQRADLEAFLAPQTRWQLTVLHEAGSVEKSLRRELEWLGSYAHKTPFTASDRRSMKTLCQTIVSKLDLIDAVAPDPEDATDGA